MTHCVHHISVQDPAPAGYDGVLATILCRALGDLWGTGILSRVCRSIAGRPTRTSLPTSLIRDGQRLTVLICPETGAGRPDIGLGASGGGGGGSGVFPCAWGVRLAA